MLPRGWTILVLWLSVASGMACHGTRREPFSQLEGELREAIQGPDEDCQKPRNIDPALQGLLDDYIADAQALGPQHFPLDRIALVRTLRLVPHGSAELQNDKSRMGLNRRIECYDGERIYHIYIADPETTPGHHRLRGKHMLRQVVYHELAHTYFDHYNDDPDASSTDVGIMAAITDDRALSDDEMEQRKFELFAAESDYLSYLPPRD